MLGTIIGDIVGSVYEFKNYRAKDFDPLFNPKARYTDDTVCTIAVADALANGVEPQKKVAGMVPSVLRERWLGPKICSLDL